MTFAVGPIVSSLCIAMVWEQNPEWADLRKPVLEFAAKFSVYSCRPVSVEEYGNTHRNGQRGRRYIDYHTRGSETLFSFPIHLSSWSSSIAGQEQQLARKSCGVISHQVW